MKTQISAMAVSAAQPKPNFGKKNQTNGSVNVIGIAEFKTMDRVLYLFLRRIRKRTSVSEQRVSAYAKRKPNRVTLA